MQHVDQPDASADSSFRAPGYIITLDQRAIDDCAVELDPVMSRLAAAPPVLVFAMFGDDRRQHLIRLGRNARNRCALFLASNRYACEWFEANCQPGDTLEVQILSPVQFWLGRI